MRTQWASRMADLLVPGGLLICLEFPLFKEPSSLGPPWPLQGVYWNLLVEGGDGILSGCPVKLELDQQSEMNTSSASFSASGTGTGTGTGLFERKWYFKPEVSYESGRGTDMLSVYVRK